MSKKPYPCIETLVEIPARGHLVRVWIDQEHVPIDLDHSHEIRLALEIQKLAWDSDESLVEQIKELEPRVSAVQVSQKIGNMFVGTVIYTVDF